MSVRMAKDQDLPVNPLRIAGACGRLMCCLKYEHPLYQDFREKAPKLGEAVETPEGPGVVTGHNVPGDKVVVKLTADGRKCACTRASVCGSRQAYEAKYGDGGPEAGRARPAGGRDGRDRRRAARGERPLAAVPAILVALRPAHRRVLQLVGQPGGHAAPPVAAQRRPVRGCGWRRARPPRSPGTTRRSCTGGPAITGSSARGCWSRSTTAARLAAVLAAGDQAARERPGTPDRVAGDQPRRPG